ncbi:MAG: PAS domain S-box protein [Firmicutes bacterium]|nr:PAS domain S-box protein [Bacillota bacterium]
MPVKNSIQKKFVVILLLVPILFTLFLGITSITLFGDSMNRLINAENAFDEDYIQMRNKRKADFIAGIGMDRLKSGDSVVINTLRDFILINPEVLGFEITDEADNLVYSGGERNPRHFTSIVKSIIRDRGGIYRGKVTLYISNEILFKSKVQQDIIRRQMTSDIFLLLLMVFIVSTLGMLVLGGVMMKDTLIEPLGKLVKATRQLSAGDLDVRVSNPSDDELGELSKSFNAMAESIQKRESQIKESGDFLQQIFRAAREHGIISANTDESINMYSVGAYNILGYSIDETGGRKLRSVLGKNWEQDFDKIMPKLLDGHLGFDGETQLMRKDGTTFPAHLSLYPIKSYSGEVNGILALFKDVSQQKELEKALARSEYNYRTLVETNLGMVYLIQDGVFVYVNPAFCKTFGYSLEETVGRPISDFIDENSRKLVDENIRKRMNGEIESLRYDFVGKDRDGRTFNLEVHGTIIEYMGKPAIQGTAIDITDRKKFEDELIASNQKIQEELVKKEKLAVLGQVTGTVSHELRNPLGVIRSSLFYIKNRVEASDEKVAKHLDRMERQIQICNNIIQDLLEYTRQWIPELAPSDINRLIDNTIQEMRITTGVEALVKLDYTIPIMKIDQEKMRQVIFNLIDNALHALKEGGTIHIETIGRGDSCEIIIRDNGCGIAPENLERIFEPLFTTRARGIGLGLSNVKKVVEAHGGEIIVESKIDCGTTMKIILPVIRR